MKILFVALIAVICMSALGLNLWSKDDVDGKGEASEQRVELGTVNWTRDFEAAKKLSIDSKRPIFLLFQEVPGCQTCQNFGSQPLSHPLLVEAIEDLFIPVLVYNNKEGADAELLKSFDEPAWNNPVVRYLSGSGQDLLPREEGIWGTAGTATRMIAALKAAGQKVPVYLQIVAEESNHGTESAEFAMHCYWEGEAKLGSIPGVTSTRSGWRGNLEVVRVEYDPSIVDYDQLLATAQKFECASKVFAHTEAQLKTAMNAVGDKASKVNGSMRDAKASDQKYYLQQTRYRHLPMTELQATKINSNLAANQPVDNLLSPRQKAMYEQIEAIVRADQNALDDFVSPNDSAQMADYAKKLEKKIAAVQNHK